MKHNKPNISSLPGGWDPSFYPKLEMEKLPLHWIEKVQDDIGIIHNLLTDKDCDLLKGFYNQAPRKEKVSVQGNKDQMDDRIGSNRATIWSPGLASELWMKMNMFFRDHRSMSVFSSTDWHQGKVAREWLPIGVSPMLRFMKYTEGGEHYAHYDAGYIYDNPEIRTLSSFVIYLTTNDSGSTRFIKDGQDRVPVYLRDHNDWTRETKDDEVFFSSMPKKGKMLFFDHRICHDVSKFEGTERMIIRGDIIYKAYNK